MKNYLPHHILILILMMTVLPSSPASAQQESPTQLPPASLPEKQVLFDGSNLEHWTGMTKDGEREDRPWKIVIDRLDVGLQIHGHHQRLWGLLPAPGVESVVQVPH
jgi:hypothetical protein